MLNMNLESNINSVPYLDYMQKQLEKSNVKSKEHQDKERARKEPKTMLEF